MDVEIGEAFGMRGEDQPRGEEIEAREGRDRHQRAARHRDVVARDPRRLPEGQEVEHHEDREQRGQPADRELLALGLGRKARLDRAPEPAEQLDHREAEQQAVERKDKFEIAHAIRFHSAGRMMR